MVQHRSDSQIFNVTSRGVIAIAIPMTLAYSSTPLVGLVDTAVIGRLGDAALLGGIAVGAIIFDVLFTTFNFLRAGTTGLTAQAFGAGDGIEQRAIFLRAMIIALLIGLAVIVVRQPITEVGIGIMSPSDDVEEATRRYIDIRIFATPFVLANYAILGWFLGLGRAGIGLALQTLLNGLNIGLDLLFVIGFGWNVEGVAAATFIAEATTAVAGIILVLALTRGGHWPAWAAIANAVRFRRMIAVNRDIMIRSFALLAAFAFFTREGARAGDIILGANAVLLNFFMIAGYLLDGFATAAEQLAGRAVGARRRDAFDATVRLTLLWGIVISAVLSSLFYVAGPLMIDAMTTNADIRATARIFLIWAALTPIVGVVAFQMDGIFIGSTWSSDMRNMMLVSLAAFFCRVVGFGVDHRQSRLMAGPDGIPGPARHHPQLALPSTGARNLPVGLKYCLKHLQDAFRRPSKRRLAAIDDDRTLDQHWIVDHRPDERVIIFDRTKAELLVKLFLGAHQRPRRNAEFLKNGLDVVGTRRFLEIFDDCRLDVVVAQQLQRLAGFRTPRIVPNGYGHGCLLIVNTDQPVFSVAQLSTSILVASEMLASPRRSSSPDRCLRIRLVRSSPSNTIPV